MIDIFLIFLCIFLILCCVLWTYVLIFFIWYKVPLISTPKPVIKAMIELAEVEENQVICEIGCGFAQLLFLLVQGKPKNTYIGIDVLGPVIWFNTLKARFLQRDICFKKQNFFKADLSENDIIFCYLWDSIMEDLYVKKWEEFKPGMKLISHDFPIKKLRPVVTQKIGRSTVYVYQKN